MHSKIDQVSVLSSSQIALLEGGWFMLLLLVFIIYCFAVFSCTRKNVCCINLLDQEDEQLFEEELEFCCMGKNIFSCRGDRSCYCPRIYILIFGGLACVHVFLGILFLIITPSVMSNIRMDVQTGAWVDEHGNLNSNMVPRLVLVIVTQISALVWIVLMLVWSVMGSRSRPKMEFVEIKL
eukprot:TRINITY_DN10094_c0_g1_i1.p1 TRINITY_DN10094_c0_g1~~TRINITY_DN10094_c0_g1_i1.p1  ORF type:complete len:180 (-),score=15.56 TRINITY_DN10094_c0_g1_i1:3-542(-)